MIRIRVGQGFKSSAGEGVRDGLSLEVDGVGLWPEVADAPLVETHERLAQAMAALYGGERAAQVSLDAEGLEVCFWRPAGHDVEVALVSLGAQPRLTRPPVILPLAELGEAVAKSARELARDPDVAARGAGGSLPALRAAVDRLANTILQAVETRDGPGFSLELSGHGGLGVTFFDEAGRLAAFTRRSAAGLPFLLGPGVVTPTGGAPLEGPPFLTLLGLARAAGAGSDVGPPRPGGAQAEAVFRAGLDAAIGLTLRNPALSGNPWLEALELRCTEGLARLRPPPAPRADEARDEAAEARDRDARPLVPHTLRRMTLARLWAKPVLVGEAGGRFVRGRGFLAIVTARACHVFGRTGRTRRIFRSPGGLALSPSGEALLGENDRVLLRELSGEARWFRPHDGTRLGPLCLELELGLLTSLGSHGVVALERHTGRELWRFAPPRTGRLLVASIGGRVIAGADDGLVHGLDARDGTVRFRIRGPLPCVAPPVALVNGAVCVLARGDQTVVFAFDARSADAGFAPGTIRFSRELALSRPCPPVVQRQRVIVGGARDGKTLVLCLGDGGRVLWERAVPLEAGSLRLLALEGGAIATDARGAAVRLLPDGQPEWVLGAAGEALERRIAPRLERRVLVVPGPVLRLVEPRGGRVLGELEAGPSLVDVTVAPNFDVFTYTEPGELCAYRPGALLSVV